MAGLMHSSFEAQFQAAFGSWPPHPRHAAGSSPRVKLPSQRNDFDRGRRDAFQVECQWVGELSALTVGHNNKGVAPGWHLDQVEVKNSRTGAPTAPKS
jgi:PLAT/LH2 domain